MCVCVCGGGCACVRAGMWVHQCVQCFHLSISRHSTHHNHNWISIIFSFIINCRFCDFKKGAYPKNSHTICIVTLNKCSFNCLCVKLLVFLKSQTSVASYTCVSRVLINLMPAVPQHRGKAQSIATHRC